MRLLLLALLFAAPAFPWGCEGHQAIALLAQKLMNPRAVEEAERLLRAFPADPPPTGFCKPAPFSLLSQAATWPDDVRSIPKEKGGRPETGGWHYIDVPFGGQMTNLKAYCPADTSCVLEAIENQLAVLRQPIDSKEKADALRFLIHFVGDLHQPLHSSTNGDKGGNCVPIAMFDHPAELRGRTAEEKAHGNYSPNLHSVWDTDILKREMNGTDVPAFARALEDEASAKRASWGRGDVSDWIRESNRQAEKVVYGKLLPSGRADKRLIASLHEAKDVAQCSDDNLSQKAFEANLKVDARYEKLAEPVVHEQMLKAAIRLAGMLDQTWPPGR